MVIWLAAWGGAAGAAGAEPAARLAGREAPQTGAGRVLTMAAEVRALSPAEAAREQPVRLRATVTAFPSESAVGYFVVDESAPIYVRIDPTAREPEEGLMVGQVVEIVGVSAPGAYAPQVREFARKVIGYADLPAPRRLSYEELASGREDCQYAEIEGIVRRVTDIGLVLAMGDGRVEVACTAYDSAQLERVVDARVRLRGVVSGRFNQKRQWVGVRFTVTGAESMEVIRVAPAEAFGGRAHAVGELLQWGLNQAGRHRVKVRGVVTHSVPGEALFLRADGVGLQVQTSETQACAPGDGVEVVGFPALGVYSAVLEDAVFRLVGKEARPQPAPAAAAQLMAGEWDANLVSVRGTLLETVRQQGARVLVMQVGEEIFHAQLATTGWDLWQPPEPGAVLDLVGICLVEETTALGARVSPRSISLVLRSPADVLVVRGPSWWTAQRLWQALGVISVTALSILAWVALLRRQVRAQTAALKEQMQREAVLEERTRIAQELHDTLDQELTGITLQLNAIVAQLKGDPMGRSLELVHRLLQRSQSEVRRSVWDLRRPASEPASLASALKQAATQLRGSAATEVVVSVCGEARSLSALVEHHLLRIALEAIANALKHAEAQRIDVVLTYAAEAISLEVADDGRGFVAAEAPGPAAGHFGLIGMRERSRKMGGTFHLESQPGRGTRITLRLQEGPSAGPPPATRT